MKIPNYLLVLMSLIIASCSNNDAVNPIPKGEEQTLSIKLSTPSLVTRAIENPLANGTQTAFETITLHFWKDQEKENPSDSRPRMVLSHSQIEEAQSAGTKVSISSDVQYVSMTANTEKTKGIVDYSILNVQKLGEDFTKKIPMTSPAVAPQQRSSSPSTKEVRLVPLPDLARIEVMGKITPKVNPVTHKSAYKSVSVEAVYLNNYYASAKASELTKKESTADWTAYESLLHDKELAAIADKSKAAAYQFFPCKNEINDDNLVHIVLKIKYVKDDETSTEVNNRWITISKYKENSQVVKEFTQGMIYKLDLASLDALFETDNEGNIVDPTDSKPETPKTDLYVNIEAYTWHEFNITPDL